MLKLPSERLNIDVFTATVNNDEMMAAIDWILEEFKRRFGAFCANYIEI